ncbi:putative membrane protein [Sulfitobacter noctilucicola]|uniref:Putative membrane protein n=1 Tax=Sulfitobacter noctilucicola TaxID=1342301 RepID=A0A7W6Q4H7_9RHOB|nr:DUF2306 domain-containing protein [Sulfitobacter noctilucicola]KIN63807.1 putative membrane protein [Sulfitobacter noctilucicola]MBB4174683.1 putative membrane protein [Sulfitobacter noctilucicola]
MNFAPLTTAAIAVQIHACLAFFAVALTIAIFSIPRGSRLHRWFGWTWVLMMVGVALSSFWIFEIRLIGPFSPIHLLSAYVLVQLVFAVRAARAGRIQEHRKSMKGMVFGALVVAGAFTFLPGRVMYQVVLGG